jgi:hypothetical protein
METTVPFTEIYVEVLPLSGGAIVRRGSTTSPQSQTESSSRLPDPLTKVSAWRHPVSLDEHPFEFIE